MQRFTDTLKAKHMSKQVQPEVKHQNPVDPVAHILNSFRETYASLLSPGTLTIWVVSTITASVAGPFGTFSSMSLLLRFGFWAAVVTLSILLGYFGHAVATSIVDASNFVRRTVLASTISSGLIAGLVYFLSSPAGPWASVGRPEFTVLLSYVFLICGSVGCFRILIHSLLNNAQLDAGVPDVEPDAVLSSAVVPPPATQQPRLAKRLPEGARGDILRVSVQDHFVDVLTDQGTTSIRMRFRDALDEIDCVEGWRVHRSHWVARAAVIEVRKEKGRMFVCLRDGSEVPVSRNYREQLEREEF